MSALTEQQLQEVEQIMREAENDWPRLTTDARVNHEVDRRVLPDVVLPWEDLSEEEHNLYFAEAQIYGKRE